MGLNWWREQPARDERAQLDTETKSLEVAALKSFAKRCYNALAAKQVPIAYLKDGVWETMTAEVQRLNDRYCVGMEQLAAIRKCKAFRKGAVQQKGA